MAVITELSQALVDESVRQFGVGEVVDFWPAADGIENTNYFVRTDDAAEFVLTVVESGELLSDVMLAILDTAEASGLPVAPPMRSESGERQIAVDEKPAILSRRMPGNHVSNPTFRQCEAIGRFLARFHVATAHLGSSAHDYPRDAGWLTRQCESAQQFLPFRRSQLLSECVTTVVSMLARTDVDVLPTGIIHGDLFRDNALFNDHGLAGVIDFHHASRGFWIFDLAVAINDWCVSPSTGGLDTGRCMALLRSYHGIRAITAQEIWFLPTFGLYAALAFWLSRLIVTFAASSEDNGQPSRDPDEFRRIVERHRSRALYFDRRLLD